MVRLPERSRSRVVLLGSARLGRPDLPDLPAVRHILPALADAFADPRLCGIAPVNIRVVLDPGGVEQAGADLVQAAGYATDMLLVYLAGHLIDGDADEPELALPGGRRGHGGGLPLHWIARTLSTSRAANRVLVVDGYLSGAEDHRVRDRCAAIVDATALVVLSDQPAGYAPPGRPGTALSRLLLDLAYRRDPHRPYLLRPVDLAVALAPGFGDRLSYTEPAEPSRVALFRSAAGQPLVPQEVRRLERLCEVALDAEQLTRRPALIAERYRALALAAHRLHGPEHPETLRMRHRLAHWTGKAGDVTTAVALYTELHADRARLLGANHPHTRGSAADLDYWSVQPTG